MPESVLDELDRLLAETEVQFEAGDITQHLESDVHFHETLVDFVENRLLKEVLDGLTNRISVIRRFAQLQPGYHMIESFKEHRAILEAIRQRDPEQPAELMRVHLERSALRIQELAE
jgi:DNA-binding FadR family transcriptional regulator